MTTAYLDGRPTAKMRLRIQDQGIVLPYGTGPDRCDYLGARDMWVFEADGTYHLFYDGAGPEGWRCCHAVSQDMVNWRVLGPILELGETGQPDSAYAGYGATIYEEGRWHFFYVGCEQTSPPPARIPVMPYENLKAEADSPYGPWKKRYDLRPFKTEPGTYYEGACNPGHIVKVGDEYLMFISVATLPYRGVKRTLALARTQRLDTAWQIAPEPILPLEEQVENAAVYYEETNGTWFVFTNHVGLTELGEYRDAVWVYWTQDINVWNPANKAVVVDGQSCTWSKKSIGMAAVARVGDRLGLIYDAPGGDSVDNMQNSLGLAWIDLPLIPNSGQFIAE